MRQTATRTALTRVDACRERIHADIAKWSRIIEAGNIKPN